MKSRSQDYLVLYDSLRRAKKLPDEEKLSKKFGSEKNYNRLKDQLTTTLLEFLGRNSNTVREYILTMEAAAHSSISSGNIQMASQAIGIGLNRVKIAEEYGLAKKLVRLYDLLPANSQTSESDKIIKEIRSFWQLESQISTLEKRMKEWPLSANLPPPKISPLIPLEKEVANLLSSVLPSRIRSRCLLLMRKLLTVQGKLEQAVEYSKEYLASLTDQNLPLLEIEDKKLQERGDFSLLLGAMGLNKAFEIANQYLLPINYRSLPVQNRAKILFAINSIWYAVEFGKINQSENLISQVEAILFSGDYPVKDKEWITLAFYLGKYYFVLERFSKSNKVLHQLSVMETEERSFSLNFPFVIIVRILSFLERNEPDFEIVQSLRNQLRRVVNESGFKHQYFQVFDDLVENYLSHGKYWKDGHSGKIKTNLEQLVSDSFEGRPFNRFDLYGWYLSKVSFDSFKEYLESKTKKSPEGLIQALSGEKVS